MRGRILRTGIAVAAFSMAMAVPAAAHAGDSTEDTTSLPVGETTDTATVGGFWSCQTNWVAAGAAGAMTEGPWFNGDGTWDLTKKVFVQGDVTWDAASGTFRARVLLDNPDYALPSGLRCAVRFLLPGESVADNIPPAPASRPLSRTALQTTRPRDLASAPSSSSTR